MSDSARPPAVPTPAPIPVKDAEVVSKPSDNAPLVSSSLTFGQHLFIWSMIILVGVIFGVGSSWTFLQHSPRSISGVSENDILVRKDVAERLQQALAASGETFVARSFDEYAQRVRYARYAASLGLLPEGADLDRVMDDFLAKPVGNRTMRDLLAEHHGAKDEVSRPQLRLFLAEKTAEEALFARNLAIPAVPLGVADEVKKAMAQSVESDVVVLTADHLLAEVKDDDAELQPTYERLRPTRFARNAQVTATIAAADFAALQAKAQVGDSEIAAWYESHKDQWKLPPAAATSPAIYKPLTEVSAEIRTTLARTAAEQAALAAVQAFNGQIEDKNLETADRDAFAAAAKAAGLVVTPVLTIDEQTGGKIALGTYGTIKDPAGIFAKDKGFITNPLKSEGADPTWFVLRIEGKTPAGFKALDEVRGEVKKSLAATRSYKALREQAETLRAAAEKAGPGGLAKIMADPAQAVWKATVESKSLTPTTELPQAPTEAGGTPAESRSAASLLMPERPVVLAAAEDPTLVQVRLIQAREGKADPRIDGVPATRIAEYYRDGLQRYRSTQFQRELRDHLGR